MRRTAIAAAAALAAVVTAGGLIACTPEVVPVAGAHPQPVETPSTAAPHAVCGPDDSAEADRFMLTRDDIWEDVRVGRTGVRQLHPRSGRLRRRSGRDAKPGAGGVRPELSLLPGQ